MVDLSLPSTRHSDTFNKVHDGGASLGNLRVALACELRGLTLFTAIIPFISVRIGITLCQPRDPITPGVGDPCQDLNLGLTETE
jgi:hypothetical protein